MEIRNLNTFLHVASLRNFTRASQELGYSQSNVSAQIKQLEEEIGTPLFDRIGKRVFLTAYGEALLPYARQIVSAALQLENFMKSEETMGGTLRIGVVDSLTGLLLEGTLLRYHRRFPKVQVELTVDATAALKENLRQGLLDAACLIDDPLPPADWTVWPAEEVPIVVVANPDHPLSRHETISLKDLSGQEMILMEESAPYSVHFQNALAAEQAEPHVFLKLQSASAALHLVEQGPFLSVLPLYIVLEAFRKGRVRILKTVDWNVSQQIQLVLHRNKLATSQIEGLLEEIQTTQHAILCGPPASAPDPRCPARDRSALPPPW